MTARLRLRSSSTSSKAQEATDQVRQAHTSSHHVL